MTPRQVQKTHQKGGRSEKRHRDPGFIPTNTSRDSDFWDSLTNILLTRGALQALGRRNKNRGPTNTKSPGRAPDLDLDRFARRGGPDLSHLRGVCNSLFSNTSLLKQYSGLQKGLGRMAAKAKNTTGPYDPNYEEQLREQNIWLIRRPKKHELPHNHAKIMEKLRAERPNDPRGPVITTHDAFLEKNETCSSQGALFQQVMPIIWGTPDLEVPCEYDRQFTRMRFSKEDLKDAKPDYFEGIKPANIEPEVKKDLSVMIIPDVGTALTGPAAPNFFLEIKTDGLRESVVRLQCVMDGVLGARCMHSLQNYRMEEPLYDGNAYTFSVSYYRKELRFYAIRIQPPSGNSNKPRYEAIHLEWFAMEAEEKFLPAINAYRNIRDLGEKYRRRFVRDANSRVS
ncbi:hypothetical protein F5883DRAFT_430835, partial [Diaporthe sp. PMI_573]